MADRTVTVRLRAVINDYQAAMGKARKSTDDVAKSADRGRQLGRSPAELGDSLTRNLTPPPVARGAAAPQARLGSPAQIADAVSSAMNAYAASGLSAAEATDVLVATAEAGKAEPAELAQQMGRLLPISSELGISFQDVGAGLAALSLSGNDAAA